MLVGILAVQGDYVAHANALAKLNVLSCFVKKPKDLNSCDALIIPGGESTTLLKFITANGLFAEILAFAKTNKPIFGTCAGAILLAKEVINPEQRSLGLIDMQIERNGYGRQLASSIKPGIVAMHNMIQEMVFIRAPRICKTDLKVQILANNQAEPVCVRQNNCLAATFHPELTNNLFWHRYFINM